jgi:hypothetical protein
MMQGPVRCSSPETRGGLDYTRRRRSVNGGDGCSAERLLDPIRFVPESRQDMTEIPKKWSLSAEDLLPVLLIPATSVGAWFLPDQYLGFVFAILALGLLFDLLSLFSHLMTLATGKYKSGFPLVGLLFYVWFVLAYRRSLIAPHEEGLGYIALFKLLDLLLLAGVHLLFQAPMLFQRPRDKYR